MSPPLFRHMFVLFELCLLVIEVPAAVSRDCNASDARLVALRELYCKSMGPALDCPVGNYSAAGDWPTQVVYMKNILVAVVDPATCLGTPAAINLVTWLNVVSSDPHVSMWWWNWLVFQPQYFDMPRVQPPGERIETPSTLGRKCWPFAFLEQIWKTLRPEMLDTMLRANVNLTAFVSAYDAAVPMSMSLCDRVMANCFANATYNPALRNGTCPGDVDQFFVGFAWENGNDNATRSGLCPVGNCWRNNCVGYPYPRYNQTDDWQTAVMFSVDTTLNCILTQCTFDDLNSTASRSVTPPVALPTCL